MVSPDPAHRAQLRPMSKALVTIDEASLQFFEDAPAAWCVRAAPWVQDFQATDAATGVRLILLGTPHRGEAEVTAQGVLGAYLNEGVRSLEGYGGAFAIMVWDPREQALRVATDRLGTRKLYLWQTRDLAVISSELQPLLRHPEAPSEIDEQAVEQFLITSHLLDERTLVKGVSNLPGGSVTTIRKHETSRHRYWQPHLGVPSGEHLDACADHLAHVLGRAITPRCDARRVLLPLSGGLDSRTLAAFIPREAMASVTACTFGPAYCYDVRYGRRLARAMQVPFRHLDLPRDFFRRYLASALDLCDGEVSIEALPIHRLLDFGEPGDTVMTGYLGDALSGGHLLGEQALEGARDPLEVVWRRQYQKRGFSETLLDEVMLPERYRPARGSTRALVYEALAAADAATLDERALLVELAFRQSRYIPYFSRLLRSRFQVETPFLDASVLDAFLALPREYRTHQRAYRRMLVRHAPALAGVPEIKTHRPVTHADRGGIGAAGAQRRPGLPLPAPLRWRWNSLKSRANELSIRASGGWLGALDRDHYARHEVDIRKTDPQWFKSMLLENAYTEDWFHRPGLERLLHEHMTNQQNHAIRINNIIAFAAWRAHTGL